MDAELRRRAESLFQLLADLPPAERAARLRAQCDDAELRREVEELLGYLGEGGSSVPELPDIARLLPADAPGFPEMTDRIGGYRLVRKLGEGGMGAVYEAEQQSPHRTVALKVIRFGLASEEVRRRFQLEAEVLGLLHHPGIAQIYEAGTADPEHGSVPFFAMELIDGRPLLEFAEAAALDDTRRLSLIEKVCAAVEHAHRKGVIHRDLKPGNILVDSLGEPKVLDFGVARAAGTGLEAAPMETARGQLLGTLPYMSPEQVSGDPRDLDTRSDVYALGVICFELLAGRTPHDVESRPIGEALRIVTEDDAPRLSSVRRDLRGDVETIVAKALEKDRARRYQSAAALGEDIARFLRHETIAARPQTVVYQLRKLARRYRAVAVGVAVAVLTLVAATAVSLSLAVIAERERDLAHQRLLQAESVGTLMEDTFAAADPRREGRDVRVVDLLRKIAPALHDRLAGVPVARAAAANTVGMSFFHLGLYDESATYLEEALVTRQGAFPGTSPEVAESLHNVALLSLRKGDYARAWRLFDEALAMRREVFGAEHGTVASTLDALGQLLESEGDLEGGELLLDEALAMRRRLLARRSTEATAIDVIDSLRHLGALVEYRGDYERAEALARQAVEACRGIGQTLQSSLAASHAGLASVLRARGKPGEAEKLLRETVDLNRKLLGSDHPDLADSLRSLGQVLLDMRLFDDAQAALDEALSICTRVFGDEHEDVARVLGDLFTLDYQRGNITLAEKNARRALEIRKRLFGETHVAVAESLQQLATCEQWKGNDARATELLNKVKTMFADSVSAESPQVASVLRGLGVFASRRQDNAEARSRLEEALSLQRKLLGPHNPQVAHCEYELAVVLQRTGEVDAAARLYEHVRDVYRRVFGEQYEGIAFVLLSEAVMLLGSDKASEAETALREVESRLLEVHPPDHWVIQNVRSVRGRALFKLGRLQEAESLLVESCRMLREKLTPEHPNAVNAVQYLLALYEATGRLEKAAECRALLPGQKAAEDSPVTR